MSAPCRSAVPQSPSPLGACAPGKAAGAADALVPEGAAAAAPAVGCAAGADDTTGASRGAQQPAGAPSPLDRLAGLSLSPGDGPPPQSGQVAAAALAVSSPPPPPPPPPAPPPRRRPSAEELAELDDINFRQWVVSSESRHVRAAELASEGASLAARLFTADSLVVAYFRWCQANAYGFQSHAEGGSVLLEKRAWVTLRSLVWPVLLDRIAKGTLLPGCNREDEVAFQVCDMQAEDRAKERPERDAASLLPIAACFGYGLALFAAITTLVLLPRTLWSPADRKSGQDFVLAVLRLIPQTAVPPVAVRFRLPAECDLVVRIEKELIPQHYGAQFCAAVLALWRNAVVADVLRSRGTLQHSVAEVAAFNADFEARKEKFIALLGLQPCGLPSCGKKEASVSHFKRCSGCDPEAAAVKYCCVEHQQAHWPVHQAVCWGFQRGLQQQRRGQREADGRGGGGAAAA